MKQDLIFASINPSEDSKKSLEEVLKDGSRRFLIQAFENEVEEYINQFKSIKYQS